jgi:archaeal flagellar protein FlaI
MPDVLLPFKSARPKSNGHGPFDSDLFRSLPVPFQEIVKKNPHLMDYLNMMPVEQLGVPEYHETLSRNMGSIANVNVIYPVRGEMFTHILNDPEDGRSTYVSVEPMLGLKLDNLLAEIEGKLLDVADDLARINAVGDEDKRVAFKKLIDKICVTNGAPGPASRSLLSRLLKSNVSSKVRVSPRQLRAIKYAIIRDKIGTGILEPIVMDKYVEDVSCSGMGPIFIEHKVFKSVKTAVSFSAYEDLDTFVMRLAERIKKPVSVANPIVDATLPDGSRINIVYGRDISKRGSNFTIRKFSETPMSIIELIEMGTLSYTMAAYLSLVIGEGMNVFVCGETASGKTTTMNAVTTFIHHNSKIVSIEDTPELQVPHQNWIREVVSTTKEKSDSGVGMFDLLKAALRQRPNEIIIGEIRGSEGAIAFQAMQTGHSVMATFHAASVERLIQRLTGSPISVPKTYVDNLNVAIFQTAVKLPNGKVGRRMVSINEIVGYDPMTQSFSFVEVFRWDPVNDTFEFSGDGNSYLLDQKISPKRGIPSHEKRRIYQEVDRRAKILEKMQKQGVKDFYEVLRVLAKAQRERLF